jgi:hypothetical protein
MLSTDMTRLVPFLAVGLASGEIPLDIASIFSVLERWGVAGLMCFIAWLLWKRDESGRQELSTLLRESIEAQISTREELKKQTEILKERRQG